MRSGQWPLPNGSTDMLPKEYVAQSRLHVGTLMELDIGALERESTYGSGYGDGGVAVATWAPAVPMILLDTEFPEPSEYEVNNYTQDEFRLVAAIKLVSPSNKDRPENRQTFFNRCESLLKKDVCVTIVDPVTSRTANLYGEHLDELQTPRTAISQTVIYAATCRGRRSGLRWRLEAWEHELAFGAVLPTLPIWLAPGLMVPLELEASYEETCRSLRIR